jgi:glycosyltransferase involved in cell wall biosynthesis
MNPAVSVIIPTYLRPVLLQRALQSVLVQSFHDLEVMVVVDGHDRETLDMLASVDDPRLHVHVPDRHLGNAEARNRGVSLTHAPLVAFLDDDDVWLPAKLERQVACVERDLDAPQVIACHFSARSESAAMTWPRRLPRPGEDLSEYFFCRTTPFTGEGIVITSTILTTRALATKVRFATGLRRHVDTDWLLRAGCEPGFHLAFPAGGEPLVVWHIERARSRITTNRDWQESLAWCREHRALFSDRGYAAFLLHVVGSNAAAQHAWSALPSLLRDALRDGRPAPVDVAAHFANFVLPSALQHRVAGWFAALRRPALSAPAVVPDE